ncbi:MAG: TetR family transcriptional regulator [Deltaproteobacteria bacterium]|nr:TetR family transcriptional regulator [Deltaproteobacteria bacterium]
MSEGDTKKELVDLALQMLRQKGPAHVSMRAVAREAGVSSSLISFHFGGKDELLDACMQRFYADLAEREGQWRQRVADAEGDRFVAICADVAEAGYQFARSWRAVVRYGGKRVAEQGGLAPQWREGLQDMLFAAWSGTIAAHTGEPPARARLRFHGAVTHVARLAMSSERDLSGLLGEEADEAVLIAHVRDLGAFVATRPDQPRQ